MFQTGLFKRQESKVGCLCFSLLILTQEECSGCTCRPPVQNVWQPWKVFSLISILHTHVVLSHKNNFNINSWHAIVCLCADILYSRPVSADFSVWFTCVHQCLPNGKRVKTTSFLVPALSLREQCHGPGTYKSQDTR